VDILLILSLPVKSYQHISGISHQILISHLSGSLVRSWILTHTLERISSLNVFLFIFKKRQILFERVQEETGQVTTDGIVVIRSLPITFLQTNVLEAEIRASV